MIARGRVPASAVELIEKEPGPCGRAFLRGRSDAHCRAAVTEAEIEMAIADDPNEGATLMARQEPRVYSRKPLAIGIFMALQARIEAGHATLEERELALRAKALYRTRYRQGNFSPLTALRLGLIDAKGNELA